MNEELKDALARSILKFKKVILPFPPELGLRLGDFFALKEIAENIKDESIYISHLHDCLFISKPAVSQMLGSLEKKGYLRRDVCLNDRRKIVLTITPKGREIMYEMSRYADEVLDEIITSFGETNVSLLLELFNSFVNISEDATKKNLEAHKKGGGPVG